MRWIDRLTLPHNALAVLAALSAGALGIALISQYAFGYAPCELCLVQRWWHGAVVVSGALFWLRNRPRTGLILQCLAIAGCLATSLFHLGVEQHLWAGTRACVGETAVSNSLADLTQQILSAPVVRCDEIRWSFAGLSMATWDAILCFVMLAFGLTNLLRKR